MIIIVEGSDAVGKDSMINNLSKLTNMEVVRGSSFEKSEEGADKMFEESKKLLLEEKDLILNRSFYSNAVYGPMYDYRSEEHTSELQSRFDLVCRLLLEKKKQSYQVYALN